MVKFIRQEAEEKANEIRVSAEEVRMLFAVRLSRKGCAETQR